MRNNTVSKLLIEQITDGQLVWESLVDDFDVVCREKVGLFCIRFYLRKCCFSLQVVIGEPGKQKFFPHIYAGAERWKKAMLERFPGEERAINKYLSLIKVGCASSGQMVSDC